ncbi:MAG: nuclear transport factor 2 family protein, partial [Proteobacteria bacterium]|nr:nuclear transport factor 2 family protein [Pseudomonadota bacterium]
MLPETEKFLKAWHAAIRDKDINLLDRHIADDAVFRSPAFWSPKSGKP